MDGSLMINGEKEDVGVGPEKCRNEKSRTEVIVMDVEENKDIGKNQASTMNEDHCRVFREIHNTMAISKVMGEQKENIDPKDVSGDLIKCIGDHIRTLVWNDPWIPSVIPNSLVRPMHFDGMVERVCDLLDDYLSWNIDVLESLFLMDVCLKNMRIGSCNLVLVIIGIGAGWSEEQIGCCTIAMYLIWDLRNIKKHEGTSPNLLQLWYKVTSIWDEFVAMQLSHRILIATQINSGGRELWRW
ncbi:uncharacterized protein G2W53_001170 [Senna tora]|uniref:Uncharacterized protein n=1 Tax=Senna tora TaxID=362788 RepID=A0A834XGZ6_9FABA|nr:uncharacterized protein G2W53_001170 [Senna tora]